MYFAMFTNKLNLLKKGFNNKYVDKKTHIQIKEFHKKKFRNVFSRLISDFRCFNFRIIELCGEKIMLNVLYNLELVKVVGSNTTNKRAIAEIGH